MNFREITFQKNVLVSTLDFIARAKENDGVLFLFNVNEVYFLIDKKWIHIEKSKNFMSFTQFFEKIAHFILKNIFIYKMAEGS